MSNDFFLTDRLDAVQTLVGVTANVKALTFVTLWSGPAANLIAYFDGERMHKFDAMYLVSGDTLTLTVRLGK